MINVIVIKSTGGILLEIKPVTYDSTLVSFSIDGHILDKTIRTVSLTEIPKEIFSNHESMVLDCYMNGEETMSIELYEVNKARLLKNSTIEDDESLEFDDIKQEVEYQYFLRNWKSKHKKTTWTTPQEFTVLYALESEYPEIVPYYSLDLNVDSLKNVMCKYTGDAVSILKKVAAKYGFTEVPDNSFDKNTLGLKFSIPNHSNVKYIKVNEKYLFNKDNCLMLPMTNTYEQCVKRYKQQEKIFEDALKIEKSIVENKPINELTRGEIISRIKIIENIAYGLEVKKVSEASERLLKEKLKELVKYIAENE